MIAETYDVDVTDTKEEDPYTTLFPPNALSVKQGAEAPYFIVSLKGCLNLCQVLKLTGTS